MMLQLAPDGLPLLTSGQEALEAQLLGRSWPQNAQKADSEFRISLLTCVETAGFEPATP